MAEPDRPPGQLERNHAKGTCEQVVVGILMLCVMITGTITNFTAQMRGKLLGKNNYASSVSDAPIQLGINLICLSIAMCTGHVGTEQLTRVFKFRRRWSENGVWKFMVIAAVCDAMNYVTGLASQANLTALMMALMNQAVTPFTVLCSLVLLGTRYTFWESLAVMTVVIAAICCVLVAEDTGKGQNPIFWAAFAALTTSFAALSFVLKEMAFREFKQGGCKKMREVSTAPTGSSRGSELTSVSASGGGLTGAAQPLASSESADAGMEVGEDGEGPQDQLNIFVVASILQVVNLFVCIPAAILNQLVTGENPTLAALFHGIAFIYSEWHIARTYFIAVVVNLAFNLSLLACTSKASALLTFLSLKVVVPLTAVCSPLPWPIIGPNPVDSREWAVLVVMMVAIAGFRAGNIQREKRGLNTCFWPLKCCGS